MLLKISHTTHYIYDEPVEYSLLQARLTPKSRAGQKVRDWMITIDGGTKETEFDDEHNNRVTLVCMDAGAREIRIHTEGAVETENLNGVIGTQGGYAPLWLFERTTKLTKPGTHCRQIAKRIAGKYDSEINQLHALSTEILEQVTYETGRTDTGTTAEQALEAGHGVCQDHAHIFLACARHMGFPARYVSGYLLMDGQIDQEASHAWAEAYVEGLGWIGFDIANGISPDDRYIRIATGLDYREAAPIVGMRLGEGIESMKVSIQIQQ